MFENRFTNNGGLYRERGGLQEVTLMKMENSVVIQLLLKAV